tara:strand:+ start:91 stop:405 length:315 start_codon:yes stop_codon:yes gene_type:complete
MSSNPEQSKLHLSPAQYQEAQFNAKDRGEDLRLGQWLVNTYGTEGTGYPHIFYLDDPAQVWSQVEVVEEDDPKCIIIEVEGGCVTDVTGLPSGYCFRIIDHDNH